MMNRNLLLLLGLVATETIAIAQEPPQIDWEIDATATNLAFSADGATMYTGGLNSLPPYYYGNITKWDVPSRTEIYTLASGGSGAIGRTNALAVTADGTAFASGHGRVVCPPEGPCYDVAVGFNVWDAAFGTPQFTLDDGDIDGLVQAVAFSHDGEFVAFGMSRSFGPEIRVYNYPEYTLHGTFDGHGDGTFGAAFSPTENLLATGGWDGRVRLWDVETNQLVRTIVHGSYTDGGYPTSLTFSPDGSRLAVAGSGYSLTANVWDVASGELLYSLPTGAGQYGTSSATVAFSPNGRYLVGATMRYASPEWGGVIKIWDLDDGSLAREYTEEPIGPVGSPMFVAVSPAADDWIAYTYDYQVKFAQTDLDLGGKTTNCPGDIDGDGATDQSDLGLLLASYELAPNDPFFDPRADLNDDGEVGQADLGILLANYACGS
jgi:WD40 repeat protein